MPVINRYRVSKYLIGRSQLVRRCNTSHVADTPGLTVTSSQPPPPFNSTNRSRRQSGEITPILRPFKGLSAATQPCRDAAGRRRRTTNAVLCNALIRPAFSPEHQCTCCLRCRRGNCRRPEPHHAHYRHDRDDGHDSGGRVFGPEVKLLQPRPNQPASCSLSISAWRSLSSRPLAVTSRSTNSITARGALSP